LKASERNHLRENNAHGQSVLSLTKHSLVSTSTRPASTTQARDTWRCATRHRASKNCLRLGVQLQQDKQSSGARFLLM